MADLITLPEILAARERIRSAAVYTPLVPLEPGRVHDAGYLLGPHTPPILLKNEAAQPIGSFKLRGAFNKVAALRERDPAAFARGVITFSSGNHAQGVAYAARALGTRAVIVMPDNAPAIKRDATAALGAEIVTVGPASTERKRKAEELVDRHGYAMVPPYDDPDIIAGQATCGLEIAEQLLAADAPEATAAAPAGASPDSRAVAPRTLVLCPVSGGGLLSGTATGLKLAMEAAQAPMPQVWGCEPELAGDARESFYGKQLVTWPAEHTTRTLADGLRTQSLGERNFEHILHFVDGVVLVNEAEIRAATRLILAATEIVAEPSGAVTLAAALFHAEELPPADRIVAVVSGGNIDPALRGELQAETAAEVATV
jgi:threo-3-hydroxy-L-aspartate ammonia-lyase